MYFLFTLKKINFRFYDNYHAICEFTMVKFFILIVAITIFKNNCTCITFLLIAYLQHENISLYFRSLMTNQVNSRSGASSQSIRIPEFRSLVSGRFCFVMALRMMTTLLGWWIYNLTNAPFAIGLIGLSEVVPAVSLALYAGHVIDKSDKQKLLRRGIILYFIAALILLLLSIKNTTHIFSNSSIAVFIYVIVFCTGIIRSFVGPVFSVILAQVVPRELLQNATTWNQGAYLSASVTGHAAGGLLIATLGNTGTFSVIVCFIIIAFSILFNIKPKPPLGEKSEKRTWESVKEGLNFVFKTKELLSTIEKYIHNN